MNLTYYIYYIIEDSLKEVLNGTEVLLHLFYHRRFCLKGPVWTWGTTTVTFILQWEILLKRSCMDLTYYYIYFILGISGPGVLLHLFYHWRFCKRGSLGPGVLFIHDIIEDSFKDVQSSKIVFKRFYNRRLCYSSLVRTWGNTCII